MKTGLILEGGGMRGIFTVGILDVFMENNIEFDGTIGVSAGAAFGCNYKSRQIGRALRYNINYRNDKRYASFKSLRETGNFFGVDFCYREIPYELDPIDFEAYNKNPMEFYAVATDMETGQAVYRNISTFDHDAMEFIRASASIPAMSTPVLLDGMKLSDGGTADSVPLKYFESIGYDRNVVVLTQPYGYVKKRNKMMPYVRIAERQFPALIKALDERPKMYNDELQYIYDKEKSGEIIVIRPPKKVKLIPGKSSEADYRDVYNMGRKCAEVYLDRIRKFLEK